MLPDVMENRQPPLRCELGHGIEQRIIGAAACEELDTNRTASGTPLDLPKCVLGVVRIHGGEHPNALRLASTNRQHRVVAARYVGGRWEIRRRRETVTAENRCNVVRDADP